VSSTPGIGKKVLLVDDDPDITLTYSLALEDSGYVVDTYNDPLVALTRFKPNFYDLLLLDVKMPQMNGLELYEQIKKWMVTLGFVLLVLSISRAKPKENNSQQCKLIVLFRNQLKWVSF
jgi:CheY-like chemotaxis protein